MPADVPNPDHEPKWLWATRITAEAARTAMIKGRTPQERCEIYERLIFTACQASRKNSGQSGSISESTVSISNTFLDKELGVAESIMISEFEDL